MKDFSFRAECAADVERFQEVCTRRGLLTVCTLYSDKDSSEVEVELQSTASLQELRKAVRQVKDGFEMIETLREGRLADNGSSRGFMFSSDPAERTRLWRQAEAEKLGISVEELERDIREFERSLELPDDEAAQQQMHDDEAEKQRKEKGLQAIRQAVWDGWSTDDTGFAGVHDAVVWTGMSESPTREQSKAVFMLLTEGIIGAGLSQGFDSTEVIEAICVYIEHNEDTVRAALNGAPG